MGEHTPDEPELVGDCTHCDKKNTQLVAGTLMSSCCALVALCALAAFVSARAATPIPDVADTLTSVSAASVILLMSKPVGNSTLMVSSEVFAENMMT